MTAKNRQKNSEKGAASGQQDDAPKKNQPSASVSAAAHHGGSSSSSSRSGSCLGLLATTVFYAALMGAAGFAAFHVQHVVEEIRESNAKQEESARHYSDIATKMVNVVQQVSVKGKRLDNWGEVWMVQTLGATSFCLVSLGKSHNCERRLWVQLHNRSHKLLCT